jgi:hypothetical protein
MRTKLFAPRVHGLPGSYIFNADSRYAQLDLASLGLLAPIGGADGTAGFHTRADILNKLADGTDLNTLWNDYQALLAAFSTQRQAMIDYLTFRVTNEIEYVPVLGASMDFEESSEFGVPRARRPELQYFALGFPFKWYDMAARYTWQFLINANRAQVDQVQNSALDASNRLEFRLVMNRLFNNVNGSATIGGNPYTVYSFYNADGQIPPAYKNFVHDGTHTHFLSSGAATVDAGDLEQMITHLTHHGFSADQGVQIVILVSATEAATIRLFKAGTGGATYDFVPATGAQGTAIPSILVPGAQIVNQQPSINSVPGMLTIGQYGQALIVQEDYIPVGWMVAIATGGKANLQNPIGVREDPRANLQGLILKPGDNNGYPLINSMFIQGMGVGVRQRGGTVVMKITAGAYTIPTQYP